jgi:multidrug efflux pump subunit AcrA (membrane-fusion protein)
MRQKLRSTILLLCILLLVQALSGCAFLPEEEELPPPPVYKADAVTYDQVQIMRGDLQVWEKFSCKYQAAVEEKVAFKLEGLEIVQIYVTLGEEVTAGQLLAELESTEMEERLVAQREKVAELKLTAEQLADTRSLQREKEELELKWIASRIEQGLAKQSEYDAKARSNQANEEAYEAKRSYYSSLITIESERLDALLEERELYRIYAGIDGTVRSLGSADKLSSVTTPFVIISDYSTNRFTCTLREAGLFEVGDTVTITPNDKDMQPIETVVTAIEDLSTEKAVKLELSLQPVVPNTLLKNGDKGAILYLAEESLDTLYLPIDLVQINPQFSLVYCIDDDGALYTQVVTVGIVTDDYVEIKDGLKEGDYVVDNSKK